MARWRGRSDPVAANRSRGRIGARGYLFHLCAVLVASILYGATRARLSNSTSCRFVRRRRRVDIRRIDREPPPRTRPRPLYGSNCWRKLVLVRAVLGVRGCSGLLFQAFRVVVEPSGLCNQVILFGDARRPASRNAVVL